MAFIEVCKAVDVPLGQGMTVEASGQAIALFNVNGKFYATQNTCPHSGGSLGDGILEGTTITCPLHAWQYDVTTGNGMAKLQTYPTKVEDGKVFVDI